MQRLSIVEHLHLIGGRRHADRLASQISVNTRQFADHGVIAALPGEAQQRGLTQGIGKVHDTFKCVILRNGFNQILGADTDVDAQPLVIGLCGHGGFYLAPPIKGDCCFGTRISDLTRQQVHRR